MEKKGDDGEREKLGSMGLRSTRHEGIYGSGEESDSQHVSISQPIRQ